MKGFIYSIISLVCFLNITSVGAEEDLNVKAKVGFYNATGIVSGNKIGEYQLKGSKSEIIEQLILIKADEERGILNDKEIDLNIEGLDLTESSRRYIKSESKKIANTADNERDFAGYFIFTPKIGLATAFAGLNYYLTKDGSSPTKENINWKNRFLITFGKRVDEFSGSDLKDKYDDVLFLGLGYAFNDSFSLTTGATWLREKDIAGYKPEFGIGFSAAIDEIYSLLSKNISIGGNEQK